MRRLALLFGVGCLAVLIPAAASAQSSIAGNVRDASGAVLPGVAVEASSRRSSSGRARSSPTIRGDTRSSIFVPAFTR